MVQGWNKILKSGGAKAVGRKAPEKIFAAAPPLIQFAPPLIGAHDLFVPPILFTL